MSNLKFKILLVEDDFNLGNLLSELLSNYDYEVKLFRDGETALKQFDKHNFDLCIIDVMMPKMDGFTLVNNIRQSNKLIPIIFLTAKSLKTDKLQGYKIGADDFITKPFDEQELLWKINAIHRKKLNPIVSKKIDKIKIGNYIFDYQGLSLAYKENSYRITEKESEILNYFSLNRNKIIRREDMLKALWGENDYFMGRSLDVFISRLRKYLKEDERILIENVFGVGFIFKCPS